MGRARPFTLVAQRDGDAQRQVEASRTYAFSTVTKLTFQTGSDLLDQLTTQYIPRVFNLTFPHHVGGPASPRASTWRRISEDSPQLDFLLTLPC